MGNKLNIRDHIEYIIKREGESFEFNEKEIEKEYLHSQTEKSSIAIKILSVLGGFLATLTFLGFLLLANLYESELGLVITGSIFIGAALWLNSIHKKLVVGTVSVSAYAIGFCLLGFGLAELGVGDFTICVLFVILSLLTIGITKSYILSVVSIVTINGCFIHLIITNDLHSLIHVYDAILLVLLTYVFLNEAKLLANKRISSVLYNPIRIGLLISLLSGLVLVGQREIFDFGVKHIWVSSVGTIPLTIYVISIIAKTVGTTKARSLYLIYCFSILVLLPTAMSPAISGTLLIVLLSFLVQYKTGVAIGVLSFVYFISQYYYDLNFTLLTKSILLFVSGVVFLLFYVFTHKKLGQNEEV